MKMNDSYLVKGAKIKCTCGSQVGELKVENKNVCLLKVPIATVDDCEVDKNIPRFGICSVTGKPCVPMILGKWLCPHEQTKINGASAITTESALVCGKGGIILSETNGQEAIMKILKKAEKSLKNLLGLGCSPFSGDPVNLMTGNYVLQADDLHIVGNYPLSFIRTYNSLSDENTVCGNRWSHNHQVYLIDHHKTIEIHTGDGGQVRTFERTDAGEYTTNELAKESLRLSMEGYIYKNIQNQTFLFNKDGLCKEIKDKNENFTAYTYTNNLLTKVQNSAGYLLFSYNNDGKLECVSDHSGRSVTFEYSNGNLIKAANLLGGFKKYTYDENNLLIEEITPYGVKKVVNEFDQDGRAVKQLFPDGGTMEYQYDDDRTVFVDQNKNKIRFYRDKWQRDCRTTSHDGQIEKRFNEKHQLTEITDNNGNKTSYDYDGEGNMSLIKDAAGNETKIEYDRLKHPVKLIYPDGTFIKTHYDQKGQVIQNIDQLGRMFQYQYHSNGMIKTIIHPDASEMHVEFDDRGNIIEVANPFGSKVKYEYDQLNRVTATIDGNGNRTQYEYNQNNDIIEMKDALGFSKKYIYNYNGKITEIIDQNGNSTTWEYNDMSCPVKKTDPQGRETIRQYDLLWNVSQHTEANGAVTKYLYNKSNRLEKVIAPEGGETSYQYDGNGNRVKTILPDGSSILYHYDALNRMIQIDYPNETSSYFQYDFSGKIIRVIDPMGGEYCMEYDAAGQKIKQTDPSGKISRFEYNELGMITKVIEPLSRITEYQYFPGGRLKYKKFPDGSELHYSYDSNGNLIAKQDHTGYQVTFTYDVLNRISFISNSMGQSKAFTYDGVGNILSVKNNKGIVTDYEYTKSGALQAVIDPTGLKTLYSYDEVDRIVSVKQIAPLTLEEELEEARNINKQKELLLLRYKRNLEGEVICSENAAGFKEEYQRDYFGRILTYTDQEDKETHYTYDSSGNISSIMFPDGKKVMMEYNALNQLVQLKDWLGSTIIKRSSSGMPDYITDHQGNTIQYDWNIYGNRTRTTYPDGQDIEYEYDDASQKIKKIQWADQFVEYHYNEAGFLSSKKYSNKQESRYGYDSIGKLKYLNHSYHNGFLNYQYEYDSDGLPVNIKRISEEGEEHLRYHYDNLNRLTEVRNGINTVRKYEYDLFGNRSFKKENGIDTEYHYNELNQLIREETGDLVRSYEYDKRGNIRCCYENEEIRDNYFYNGRNQLEKIRKQNGIEISYFYDGFGQRTVKQRKEHVESDFYGHQKPDVSSVEFIIDYTRGNHNLIGERCDTISKSYIWESQSHQLVGLIEDEKNFFYQNDSLGTPMRLLGQTGTVRSRYDYDEFGKHSRKVSGESYFGFTGYYYEDETELYYAGRRYYNSNIGLFYGLDSVKGNTCEPMTLHPYLFCLNNPLLFIDPDGAKPGAVTGPDGTEAHTLLEAYFEAYYSGLPYVARTEETIPGGNPEAKTTNGRYDMILMYQNQVELYEIKHYSHYNEASHMSDLPRFNSYMDGLQDMYPEYTISPGTTFNPDQLHIPSKRYPDYYIKYYTYYNNGYTKNMDGKEINNTYAGFIYWSYVKKDKEKDKHRYIWIPNQNNNSDSGSKNSKNDNVIQFPDVRGEDTAAAAIIGGVALTIFIIELVISVVTGIPIVCPV